MCGRKKGFLSNPVQDFEILIWVFQFIKNPPKAPKRNLPEINREREREREVLFVFGLVWLMFEVVVYMSKPKIKMRDESRSVVL